MAVLVDPIPKGLRFPKNELPLDLAPSDRGGDFAPWLMTALVVLTVLVVEVMAFAL